MKVTMIDETAEKEEAIKSKVESLVSGLEAIKKDFQAKGQAVLKEAFAEFFAKHQRVEMVMWDQYTPYFNDGESCTFGVNEIYALSAAATKQINEDGGYAYEYAIDRFEDEDEEGNAETFTDAEVEAIDDDLRVLARIPDEIFEDLFGDHVQVKATRAGFEVEECSHD